LEQPNLMAALAEFSILLQPVETTADTPQLAYSLLDIEVEDKQLVCKYSATHYKAENIEHFAQMVVKNMGWLKNF